MIINSDNPSAALHDAIGAIKKAVDDHAPLKQMSRTQRQLVQKTLDNIRPLQINLNQK